MLITVFNKLMAPAAKERNLAGLAINEGFNNVQRGRVYRLGIDVRYV